MHARALLLLMGIVSLLILPQAAASRVDAAARDPATLSLFDAGHPYQACAGPITPQQVQVLVRNAGADTDSYGLSFASLPPGWTGEIQDHVTLSPGEEGSPSLFLVNLPSPFAVTPGDYQVIVQAKSLTTGDADEAAIPIRLLSCSSVQVTAAQPELQVCAEGGRTAETTVEIRNTGKFAEPFDLAASAPWVSLSETSIVLGPGEAGTVTVVAAPPAALSGKQQVTIRASSALSQASGQATLAVDARECYDFRVSVRPGLREACVGDSLAYTLELQNLGNPDTFTIRAPSWVRPEITKIVDMQTRTELIALNVTPPEGGQLAFTVEVEGAQEGAVQQATAEVTVSQCTGVAVAISPAEKTVCSTGGKAEYAMLVSNTGRKSGTFALNASHGTLSRSSVTLAAGASQTVALTVDPSALEEDTVITATAAGSGATASATTALTLESCYAAELALTPLLVDTCPSSTIQYLLTLENTGKQVDTFALAYGGRAENVTLTPGARRVANFTVEVAPGATGSVAVNARATSPHADILTAGTLNIKPQETCFGATLENGKDAQVDVLEGMAVAVKLTNVGERDQSFRLAVQGPSWVFMVPTDATLLPGQEALTYLYATPPYGTPEGEYAVTVTATSAYTTAAYAVTIWVGEKGEVELGTPGAGGEANASAGSQAIEGGSGITLNVTFENVTGQIIRTTESPSFKTIAIGVITLIIILILVIRFAILVRK